MNYRPAQHLDNVVEEDEDEDDDGLDHVALRPAQMTTDLNTPRIDSYRFSMANLEESQDVDLDAILGELCALESQCDEEIAGVRNSKRESQRSSALEPSEEHPSGKQEGMGRTDSPDNDSAFSDNVSLLSSESSASSGGSSGASKTSSGIGIDPHPQNEIAHRAKAEKIRIALEKMKQAAVKKLFIKAFTSDGSTKSLLVDEKMTVSYVTRVLADKNHVTMEPKWGLVEHLPDLYMERVYEDHELLVENLMLWTRDSPNTLLFHERPDKYQLFRAPETFLLSGEDTALALDHDSHSRSMLLEEFFSHSHAPDISGPLYLKTDSRKVWKRYHFVLRGSGLYYYAKDKCKSLRDLSCLASFDVNQVYYGVGWRKKYKAPTEFCFAIKHPRLQQSKSSKYIKYLCAEDNATLQRWVVGIRIAKYGRQLFDNYRTLLDDLAQEDLDLLAHARSCSTPSIAQVGDSRDLHFTGSDDTNIHRRDSVVSRASSSSSSGCHSDGVSGSETGFLSDFPSGTIKRKPAVQPKLPLTSVTRQLIEVGEGVEGGTLTRRSSWRRSQTTDESNGQSTLTRGRSLRAQLSMDESGGTLVRRNQERRPTEDRMSRDSEESSTMTRVGRSQTSDETNGQSTLTRGRSLRPQLSMDESGGTLVRRNQERRPAEDRISHDNEECSTLTRGARSVQERISQESEDASAVTRAGRRGVDDAGSQSTLTRRRSVKESVRDKGRTTVDCARVNGDGVDETTTRLAADGLMEASRTLDEAVSTLMSHAQIAGCTATQLDNERTAESVFEEALERDLEAISDHSSSFGEDEDLPPPPEMFDSTLSLDSLPPPPSQSELPIFDSDLSCSSLSLASLPPYPRAASPKSDLSTPVSSGEATPTNGTPTRGKSSRAFDFQTGDNTLTRGQTSRVDSPGSGEATPTNGSLTRTVRFPSEPKSPTVHSGRSTPTNSTPSPLARGPSLKSFEFKPMDSNPRSLVQPSSNGVKAPYYPPPATNGVKPPSHATANRNTIATSPTNGVLSHQQQPRVSFLPPAGVQRRVSFATPPAPPTPTKLPPPPTDFLKDLQRVMRKKWQVAQKCAAEPSVTPHEVLGFRDPPQSKEIHVSNWVNQHYGLYENVYLPEHQALSHPLPPPPIKKRPPPPPPKRSETTHLTTRMY